MKARYLSMALMAAAGPASAQAGDTLRLEPSFGPRTSHTSACLPSQRPSLCIRLTERSAIDFANWTTEHVGKTIDVKVNNKLVCTVRLLSPLTGGLMPLSLKTQSEADTVAQELQDSAVFLTVSQHE